MLPSHLHFGASNFFARPLFGHTDKKKISTDRKNRGMIPNFSDLGVFKSNVVVNNIEDHMYRNYLWLLVIYSCFCYREPSSIPNVLKGSP